MANSTEHFIGQVLENKGCYTNFGMARHTTNKINAQALLEVDESAVRAVID